MVWKSVDCGRSWTLPPATMLESGGRGTVGSGAFLQANTSVSRDKQATRTQASGFECEIDSGAAFRRVNFADSIHWGHPPTAFSSALTSRRGTAGPEKIAS